MKATAAGWVRTMNDDDSIPTARRRLMQGASLGMATAMFGGAMGAQPEDRVGTDQQAVPLRDPRQGYPHPPFEKQSQPWPGLAGKMTPRPDHGETSYRGSGKLLGRRALITGGDSGIGRAAAIAFAREGADVAISYLPAEEPEAKEVVDLIRAAGRKAVAIPGDIKDAAFCKRLVDQAAQ